jgi:hypothetical protein
MTKATDSTDTKARAAFARAGYTATEIDKIFSDLAAHLSIKDTTS